MMARGDDVFKNMGSGCFPVVFVTIRCYIIYDKKRMPQVREGTDSRLKMGEQHNEKL